MKKGFTLIELLIVVLIIGVLSAIALPQYEKAVEKSRAAEPMTLLSALGKAQEVYYMANGTYADTFDLLDVQIPNNYQSSDKCSLFNDSTDCVANQDWAIGFLEDKTWGWTFFFAVRLQGKYAVKENSENQAVLLYLSKRPSNTSQALPQHEHTVMCSSNGNYCKTVLGGKAFSGWRNSNSGGSHTNHTL
ncbi:MAG: prepilin-type N-terminal cleavage/methylation domain-containing protein [Elusimicrobiaceae bacterium]|nr:prepilin-type N-terminal cleavage/methylation domain-containing protein [Elusimicrobiaceae bacterium]